MFRNILVPIDGSTMSRRAVARAVRFAREQKARITAIWVGPVWEPNMYAYAKDVPPGFITPRQHREHVKRTGERYLASAKKLAATAGVPFRGICVEGVFPYLEIIKAAERGKCDLIIMASHGRRGISRLLLGSVTSKVLAHAAVPVMVIR